MTRMANTPDISTALPSAAVRAPHAADMSVRPSGHSPHTQTRGRRDIAGVSLKPQHYRDILSDDAGLTRPHPDFFEVHAENYFGDGGAPHRYLTAIRERFDLSVHGIGLSIGGAGPLNPDHLANLKALVARYQPVLVSEHLAWCETGGAYFNDLLPVALTEEALAIVCDHVDQTQEAVGRRILIENPSNYLTFEQSTIPETEFLAEMARRTGCGLLLDINNVVVSSHNLARSAKTYLDAFDLDAVGEIHLAGHSEDDRSGTMLKIDDHGSAPDEEVWMLYERVIGAAGPRPTLIEWDQDVPAYDDLIAPVGTARRIMGTQNLMPHSGAEGQGVRDVVAC